jgi:hypothetical protein
MDFPAFLLAPPRGDFPDIGITPFYACDTRYHTCFYFLCQSAEFPQNPPLTAPQGPQEG